MNDGEEEDRDEEYYKQGY